MAFRDAGLKVVITRYNALLTITRMMRVTFFVFCASPRYPWGARGKDVRVTGGFCHGQGFP